MRATPGSAPSRAPGRVKGPQLVEADRREQLLAMQVQAFEILDLRGLGECVEYEYRSAVVAAGMGTGWGQRFLG